MEIYSRFKKRPTDPTPTGEKEEDTYEIQVDVRGHKSLVATGRTNVYEKIQESLEETKIENIIRRALGGDESALTIMHGTYADVREAPKSLAEMQQAIIAATNQFERLPVDYREKFNHSVEQFVAEWGTEAWMEKMKKPETLNNTPETAEKEGVKK